MEPNKVQQILEAAKISTSFTEVMKRVGYSPSGQTLAMVKRIMDEHNAELATLTAGAKSTIQRPMPELLVENSTASNKSLKKRLIADGYLENRCHAENCPSPEPVWNGKTLVLQLEHKNGIRDDNRIENLELLCPNCHTQTETWGRKSRNALAV